MTVRGAVRFTAQVQEAGEVRYDLTGLGVVTLGYDPDSYPLEPAASRLRAQIGDATAPLHVYGVALAGSCVYDPAQALASLEPHSANDLVDTRWLRALRRASKDRRPVPWRTHQRTAYVIATLTADYLHRGDAADLLAAHQRHHAAARADCHRRNLHNARVEIEDWTARADHERAMLTHQLALTEGCDAPDPGPPPPWRNPTTASTYQGRAFLFDTIGYQPKHAHPTP